MPVIYSSSNPNVPVTSPYYSSGPTTTVENQYLWGGSQFDASRSFGGSSGPGPPAGDARVAEAAKSLGYEVSDSGAAPEAPSAPKPPAPSPFGGTLPSQEPTPAKVLVPSERFPGELRSVRSDYATQTKEAPQPTDTRIYTPGPSYAKRSPRRRPWR